MKVLVAILAILICTSLKAQTKVFSVGADGIVNRENYRYYDHSSGNIYFCNNCSGDKKDMDVFKNARVVIVANKINLFIDQIIKSSETPPSLTFENKDKLVDIGYLAESKKIISTENGKPRDVQKGAYIKESKVYDVNGEMIGLVEGQEIYGAVWYLMGR